MSTKQVETKEGVIREAIQGGLFRVETDDGVSVVGALSGKMRRFHIRILPGDRVRLEFSPHDLSRGRITYRLKD
ncbi:translation initiation factor IF-1 [candidate division WWE3 bacterium]|nr:translation initiation factor IF-1 [candidate division WWE3 bacterium]